MQILKDLAELCKKAAVDLNEQIVQQGSLKGEIEALIAKRAQVEADVKAGLEELKNITVKVREERSREVQILNQNTDDAKQLKQQAEAELAKAKVANVELQNKLDAAIAQKEGMDKFATQLAARESEVEQRLAKLEALKSAI